MIGIEKSSALIRQVHDGARFLDDMDSVQSNAHGPGLVERHELDLVAYSRKVFVDGLDGR